MKNIFFLIFGLLIGNLAYCQTGNYNQITGKNQFTDSIKINKPRNNANEDSVLTIDANTRKLKFVLRGSGSLSPIDSNSRKISGEVIWDSLLVFHSTPMIVYILGRRFTAAAGNYTLDPPYVTRQRTDIWVVDTNNTIRVIKGDSSGLKPQYNPISEIEVASVNIAPNGTTPIGIINIDVYRENVEWTGTTVIAGGIFNYTINPYAGLLSTYMPDWSNGQYFQYTDATLHDFSDVSFIKWYQLSNTVPTGNVTVSFYKNDTLISSLVTVLSGQYGYNSATTGTYQLIAIPSSAFTATAPYLFNTVRFELSGASSNPIQFDNVILQDGGGVPSFGYVRTFNGRDGDVILQRSDVLWNADSAHYNSDTTYADYFNNGNKIFDLWVAQNPIYAGTNMTIVPSNVTVFGNPVTAFTFNAGGGGTSGGITWSVRDSVSTPPVTPLDSSKYLVGTSPTGVFAGHANEIATYDSTTNVFTFQSATVGDLLYDAANTMVSQWTGTAWIWISHLILYQGGNAFGQQYVFGSLDYTPVVGLTNNVRSLSIGDSTTQNTSLGFGSGRNIPLQKNSSNGVREGNTDIGYKAGEKTTTASYNTATGMGALGSTTTGGQNTATGKDALFSNVDGVNNTGIGYFALRGNVSAVDNTAIGWNAMSGSLTGQGNTAIGKNALLVNTSGQLQVAVGVDALSSNTTGSLNTGVGRQSLLNNTTGSNNAGLGINTLRMNTTGENNTGNGSSAGFYNTIGSNNTFIGYQAGAYVGDLTQANIVNNSILIGYKSRVSIDNQTNQIVIGTDVTGLGSNTALYGDSAITLSQIMGAIKLPSYGSGTHTGTATYTLQVDASGNVIEGTGGGGGGSGLANFYLKDSSLSSDRTVDLNGKVLRFSQGGVQSLFIDPTLDAESTALNATNVASANGTAFQGNVTPIQADALFSASYNDGAKVASVVSHADVSASTITYTADGHAMNGRDIRLAASDGTAVSSFEMEGIIGDFVGFDAVSSDGTNPTISIVGDATANTITSTATSNIINGTIVYNTPPNGASTDSILTRDGSTGIVNMIDASSLTPGFDAVLQKNDKILGNLRHIDVNGYQFLIGDYSGGTQTGYFRVDPAVGNYISGIAGESMVAVKTYNGNSTRWYASLGDDDNYYADGTHTYWNGIKYYPQNYSLYLQADSITFKTPSALSGSVGYVPTLVDPSTGYWTWQLGGGGSGVTNIATGLGLSGGPITSTGAIVLDTSSSVVLSRQRAAATYFRKAGDSASYVNLPNETTLTPVPTSGVTMFDSSGRWSYRTSLGKTVSFSTSLITSNSSVIDSLPNKSGVFAFLSDSTTFYSKFDSDTSRTNIYTSLAGKVSSTGTTGDINSYSATNTPSRIAAVATGFLLGSQGTSTLPAWLQAATLNTSLTTPLLNGSVASGGTLTLQSSSNGTKGKILFGTSAYDEVNNRLGIGQTTPTASLHIKAGTSTASTAPIKLTSGTNLTSAEAGAFEYNGTSLFFTPVSTRQTVAYTDLAQSWSGTQTFAGNTVGTGGLYSSATSTSSNFFGVGGTVLTAGISTSQYITNGNNIQIRTGIRGSTATVATAGTDVFALAIGDNTFVEAISGTSALAGGLYVKTQTFTDGLGATTDFQNAYLGDAPTGATNNWSLNAGASKFRSKLTLGATTTSAASLNIPTGTAPTSPNDGDVWREDNTNTGLKIRVNGVTKTISLL